MSIIRVNHTDNYTVMSNYHLRDKNLSLKAKGLLSQMLSLPPTWDFTVAGLVAINQEKNSAITSTLKELREQEYLIVTKKMPNETKSGRIEYIYDIYEQPQKKQIKEKQCIENQGVEVQYIENQVQLNKEYKNKEYKNTEYKNKDIYIGEKPASRFLPPTTVENYCLEPAPVIQLRTEWEDENFTTDVDEESDEDMQMDNNSFAKKEYAPNIELTEAEYKSFVGLYGQECADYCIRELSLWRSAKGYIRQAGSNDYAALQRWPLDSWKKRETAGAAGYGQRAYKQQFGTTQATEQPTTKPNDLKPRTQKPLYALEVWGEKTPVENMQAKYPMSGMLGFEDNERRKFYGAEVKRYLAEKRAAQASKHAKTQLPAAGE